MRNVCRLRGLLWGVIVFCASLAAEAQVISTYHSLDAHAQLLLHLDGLESSWEVMNARAADPIKAGSLAQSPISLPTDELLGRELQVSMGDVRMRLTEKVKEFIRLFAVERRSSTEAMMGVATIYAPVIDRRLTELRLPTALGMLPAALSGFHLRAIAQDGAAGLWQLNYYVAAKQGLMCNATVDERRDLYKSTRAALAYLAELHKDYGDWAVTVAAYTCGSAGITRARNRAGANAGFEEMYPYLPAQRRDYVPAFAAAAYVFTHAKQLGLRPLPMETMPLPDRIQLQEPLRFAHVAKALKIPEQELRNLNPVCRTEIIPGINMPVQLCLPKGYGERFAAMKDSIYTLQALTIEKEVIAQPKTPATSAETVERPAPAPAPAPKPYAPLAGTVPLTYTIKSGDNVGLIAQWYGISPKDLRDMNKLSSDRIKAGDKLTVYVPKAKSAALAKVDGMSFDQKQAMVGAAAPAAVQPSLPVKSNVLIHTVKQGESLWIIAKKYPGVTPEAIMKANGCSEKLQPGMKLKIPPVAK